MLLCPMFYVFISTSYLRILLLTLFPLNLSPAAILVWKAIIVPYMNHSTILIGIKIQIHRTTCMTSMHLKWKKNERCESTPKRCCHFSPAWLWIFKQLICAFVNHRDHYSRIKWAANPPEWIEVELPSVLNRRNDSHVPGYVVTQPKCK